MENEKFQINLAPGTEKAEVIIREVSNVNEIPVKPPVKLVLCGVITSPVEFLKHRIGLIDQQYCHVIVDREKIEIMLVVDENKEYERKEITGKLSVHPKFSEFGINTGKAWEPNQLGLFFKMNRSFFSTKEDAAKLVSLLTNFEARVNSVVEKQKDQKGDFKDNFSGIVTSNLPEAFNLNIPVFRGYDSEILEVEFYATVNGRDVKLQLVSAGANDVLESIRNRVIDEQVDIIRDITPSIVIIER